MVVATALAVPDRPVSVLISDMDDLTTLLGDRLDGSGPGQAFGPSKVRVLPV